MSAPTHAKGLAVYAGGKLRLVDRDAFDKRLAKLQPGDGEPFVIRVEREAEAKKHHQLKWFFGYIVEQCIAYTGETAGDREIDFRSRFLPYDVSTLSEMNFDQMAEFNRQCEQYAADVIGVTISGPDDARHYRRE